MKKAITIIFLSLLLLASTFGQTPSGNMLPNEVLVKWTGAISSNWNDPSNFENGFLPGSSNSVTILSDVAFAPVIDVVDTINSLTILSDAQLTIGSDAALYIRYADSSSLNNLGTIINNGTLAISDDLYNEGKVINSGTIDVFAKGEGSLYFFALVNRDTIINKKGAIINTYNRSFWNEYTNSILDNSGTININKVQKFSVFVCDFCITQNSNVLNRKEGEINADNIVFCWTSRGGFLTNDGVINISKEISIGISAVASNKLINTGSIFFEKNDFDNFKNINLENKGGLFEKKEKDIIAFYQKTTDASLVFWGIRLPTGQREDLIDQDVIVLPYDENTIEVRFANLKHTDKVGDVQFNVKLDGLWDIWKGSGEIGEHTFIDIPPGEYTVKIMSAIKGVWGKDVLEKKLIINPPFWKTTWFRILIGTFLLFALYRLYKYSVNRLIQAERARLLAEIAGQEKERSRLAIDLHDDFGIRISALKMYMNSIEKIVGNQDEQLAMLSRNATNIVDDSMQNLRTLLTNLSPRTLEEHGFVFAIKELSHYINKTDAVQIDISVGEGLQKLKREFSLPLYRITQELLNNSIKHAACNNISVTLKLQKETLVLTYRDDGKGFDNSTNNGNGLGLQNIKNRTSLLNGNVNYKTAPGKGVLVKIDIPYKS